MKLIKRTVCVDLDGVLAQYDGWKGIDHIGDPIPGAKEFVEALREKYEVLINTTRCNVNLPGNGSYTQEELVSMVTHWLIRHDIPFDDIHAGGGKPFAVAYVDDRAVHCEPFLAGGKHAYTVALGAVDEIASRSK